MFSEVNNQNFSILLPNASIVLTSKFCFYNIYCLFVVMLRASLNLIWGSDYSTLFIVVHFFLQLQQFGLIGSL